MITIRDLQEKKKKSQKIVALTAYDFLTAQALDHSGVDLILVGDSLGMVVYGYPSTCYVTLEDMIRHTHAVSRGVKNALLISDMPFGSYHGNPSESLQNAIDLIQAGAQGVKVEGASPSVLESIRRMLEAGILVIGHLGFTPQQVNRLGGNLIQGKEKEEAAKMIEDALLLESIGVSALVLELVPQTLAKKITEKLKIPTIGIGAGQHTDGQILVTHDMLGLYTAFKPRFVKRYAALDTVIRRSIKRFKKDVETVQFPSEDQSY
ncbi:MAG: 3-methyl-2-oxobutanoate hydroxymethyltransferase [Candidatus Margulisiibacteriota bacterium]